VEPERRNGRTGKSRHDLSSGIASDASGLGFTLGGLIFGRLIFGRWRKA
jgi:hypothetical protein